MRRVPRPTVGGAANAAFGSDDEDDAPRRPKLTLPPMSTSQAAGERMAPFFFTFSLCIVLNVLACFCCESETCEHFHTCERSFAGVGCSCLSSLRTTPPQLHYLVEATVIVSFLRSSSLLMWNSAECSDVGYPCTVVATVFSHGELGFGTQARASCAQTLTRTSNCPPFSPSRCRVTMLETLNTLYLSFCSVYTLHLRESVRT